MVSNVGEMLYCPGGYFGNYTDQLRALRYNNGGYAGGYNRMPVSNPVGGVGIPPAQYGGCGMTETSRYNPQVNDEAEESNIKDAVSMVCDAVRADRWWNFRDFDEDLIQERCVTLADTIKESKEYQILVNNKFYELMDQGLPREEAKAKSEQYGKKQLWGMLLNKYEKYVGATFRKDIDDYEDYAFNDDARCAKLVENIRKAVTK